MYQTAGESQSRQGAGQEAELAETIYERLRTTALGLHMLEKGDTVLVGLSGGADSVALVVLLSRFREEEDPSLVVSCAHINHMLRGREADEDEAFCRRLCEMLRVPFHALKKDIRRFAEEEGIGIEECARRVRYRFFEETAQRIGARRVALGHQADDNAETLIQRIARGTGVRGLVGIPPVRPIARGSSIQVIRPLIRIKSAEIRHYLKSLGQEWRQDSSNLQLIHTRNRIRLRILPALERGFHPQIREMLNRLSDCARVIDGFARERAKAFLTDPRVRVTPEQAAFSTQSLEDMPEVLRMDALRELLEEFAAPLGRFNRLHFARLAALCATAGHGAGRSRARGRRSSIPPNGRDGISLPGCVVTRERDQVRIRRAADPARPKGGTGPAPVPLPIRGVTELPQWQGRIEVEVVEASQFDLQLFIVRKEADEEAMDLDKVEGAVRVRSWQAGDRFRPFGARGTKKLQDFFTDAKVPESERYFIPIVEDARGILWVVGWRLDERARITARTKHVLKMRFRRTSPLAVHD